MSSKGGWIIRCNKTVKCYICKERTNFDDIANRFWIDGKLRFACDSCSFEFHILNLNYTKEDIKFAHSLIDLKDRRHKHDEFIESEE